VPYIKQLDRYRLNLGLSQIDPITAGELNYCISVLVQKWAKTKGISYQTLNEADGVIGCVQKEFYRRFIVPYEDKKIAENGDVNLLDFGTK
jgi:hypothetical protein